MTKKEFEILLNEGRKVLKINGGGNNVPPPQTDSMPPVDNMQMQQPPMPDNGQIPPMDSKNGMPPMDNGMEGNGESEFDTNFDAGVEADEDTDPKKYIQQLTGKLSQTLSSYNNENGTDPQLCKYVANMIIKQAAKGLDEKNRKDIIKAINTTVEDTDDEMPDDDELNDDNIQDDEDNGNPMIQEMYFKKGDFKRIMEGLGIDSDDEYSNGTSKKSCNRINKMSKKIKNRNVSNPFIGKRF